MKLNDEKAKLVLENQLLVRSIANKHKVLRAQYSYEDLVSIGNIALIKAALYYDERKGVKFSTYAYRCIEVAYLTLYRKHLVKTVSLNHPIGYNSKDEEVTLADVLEHTKSDFAKRMEEETMCSKIVEIMLSDLKGKSRTAFLYYIASVPVKEIAYKLQISKQRINVVVKEERERLVKALQKRKAENCLYSVEFVNENYLISFPYEKMGNLSQNLEAFLEEVQTVEVFPYFRVGCDNKIVTLTAPAEKESFEFIADVFQIIEKFGK